MNTRNSNLSLRQISLLAVFCSLLVIPATGASGWRTIAEDVRFPSDDVIVAFCEVTDPKYGLPTDTEKTDCTPAIQKALDDAQAAGGGTVFIPEGKYRLDGMLKIGSNVFLRGRWCQITANQPAAGTILMLYGSGQKQSILIEGSGCGVRDLIFWHPEQSVTQSNAEEYPLVIRGNASVVTIENITFINAYRGIDLSQASASCLRGIYGSPLKVGLTADKSYAVSRYDRIHFSPDYWSWSKLPGSPGADGAHRTFMRSEGTAVHIKEMDGFYFGFSDISGYRRGLHFEKGVSGDDASGKLCYVSVTDCDTALHVDDAKGFMILDCKLVGSDYGIWGNDRTHYEIHTSTIEGGIHSIFLQKNGIAELVNSTLKGETKITGPRSGYAAHHYEQVLPRFNNNYDRVRKPAKHDLFNIKQHGAIGDGKADDTAAVEAAIAAARKNGGGIVFVPDGEYRITRELDLGKGIELRGNSGGRHMVCDKTSAELGSVLFIDMPGGHENGTPFLTLGDGSGLRGIGFHYLQQDYKNFQPHPFMVRCNGSKNYIIDCSASNPYQGVELNGDEPLIEYSFIGGLKRTYRANGSTGGRIQNCHIKPDFWRTAWLPGSPKTSELEEFKWKVNAGGYEPIYLKDCDDFVVMSIFNHASHTLMTVDNSSGQTLMVGGEQLQGGYVLKNGSKTFDFLSSKCNVNHIGSRDGTFGIKSLPGFKGSARFFCSGASGTSDETWNAQDGHLFFQLTSITGPTNRGANSIHCGPEGKMTVQSGGANSHPIGIENEGSLRMENFDFAHGLLNSQVARLGANNSFPNTFVLADLNQPNPKSYGLEIDTATIEMGDALLFWNKGWAKDSLDGRRFMGARLKNGNAYSFKVTDPEFQKGKKPAVEITLFFRLDTDCTIKPFYRTRDGLKPAKQFRHKLGSDPTWKEYRFTLEDAWFGSEEDLRIEIEGESPMLAMVCFSSPVNQ